MTLYRCVKGSGMRQKKHSSGCETHLSVPSYKIYKKKI